MWPFRRKPLLPPDLAGWMFDHAEWLLSCHSRASRFADARPVPISDTSFPKNELKGHALAEPAGRVLTQIRHDTFRGRA